MNVESMVSMKQTMSTTITIVKYAMVLASEELPASSLNGISCMLANSSVNIFARMAAVQ